jgi:hypothetical protein
MTSIGTLFAFVVVSAAVIILRFKRPEAPRPFKVPGGLLFPILGILACLWLMLNLPIITWVRFLVWLDIGIFIYWFYGRRNSPLADKAEIAARPASEGFGNLLTMLGALVLFNGFFMTLLGYLTEFGIISPDMAKWHEIGVTPEASDALGLQLLGFGIVVFAVGRLIARTAAKPQPI